MNLNSINKNTTSRRSNLYATVFFITLSIGMILSYVFIDIDYVEGQSMAPTLTGGDVEVSIKLPYCKIKKQDIINIKSSAIGEEIVKRVIADEGDVISMEKGIVKINGTIINEPYLGSRTEESFSIIVPKGHIFVMGDNREVSLDSRSQNVGCIPKTEIKSKVLWRLPKTQALIGE